MTFKLLEIAFFSRTEYPFKKGEVNLKSPLIRGLWGLLFAII
jgi:hypothetical protein